MIKAFCFFSDNAFQSGLFCRLKEFCSRFVKSFAYSDTFISRVNRQKHRFSLCKWKRNKVFAIKPQNVKEIIVQLSIRFTSPVLKSAEIRNTALIRNNDLTVYYCIDIPFFKG